MNKKALQEAINTFLRTLISGSIQAIIAILSTVMLGINAEVGTIGIKWTLVLAVALTQVIGLLITALIAAKDKYVHEDPDDKRNGILPM